MLGSGKPPELHEEADPLMAVFSCKADLLEGRLVRARAGYGRQLHGPEGEVVPPIRTTASSMPPDLARPLGGPAAPALSHTRVGAGSASSTA